MSDENILDETIASTAPSAILEMTRTLLDFATRRLASGQDVTQENIAIVNRARKAVKAASIWKTPQ